MRAGGAPRPGRVASLHSYQHQRRLSSCLCVAMSCSVLLLITSGVRHLLHAQMASHGGLLPQHGKLPDEVPVWWFAPFFDRSSYGIEAATLVLGMIRSKAVPEQEVWIGTTQGNCTYEYDEAMPRPDFDLLDAAKRRANQSRAAIVICHSLPFFWARPFWSVDNCQPCPPLGYTPALAVGRAMAETDIYNAEFVKMNNRMDEVWVPSKFSQDVLVASGVQESKLHIVPIAVNTSRFDPARTSPFRLPKGQLVFGRHRRAITQEYLRDFPPPLPLPLGAVLPASSSRPSAVSKSRRRMPAAPTGQRQHAAVKSWGSRSISHAVGRRRLTSISMTAANLSEAGTEPVMVGRDLTTAAAGNSSESEPSPTSVRSLDATSPGGGDGGIGEPAPFVFISTFKWEKRKGWDRLLHAYLQEFSAADNVELYILTKMFMAGSNFSGDMYNYSAAHLRVNSEAKRKAGPTLYLISSHLEAEDYARMYRAANCYVIPTRGEGWGMPITEAMSMGIPAIVTGWSGTADFVNHRVGYPLNYTLNEVPSGEPWWFVGARWADVDIEHLRKVMRHVYDHPKEAARKGAASRRLMVSRYSPEAVGKAVAAELKRVRGMLRDGTCDHCFTTQWVATPWQVVRHHIWKGVQDKWGAAKNAVGGLTVLLTIVISLSVVAVALLLALIMWWLRPKEFRYGFSVITALIFRLVGCKVAGLAKVRGE